MWFFRSPQIVYGPESLQFLQSLDIKKAVIVTDRNVREAGLVDLVTEHLESSDIKIIDGIPEEPSIEQINEHLGSVTDFKPQFIIAVGGGSAMDAAKLLCFKFARPDLDYFDITPLEPLGVKGRIGLIAIPTTSGTGSDCTWAAVITDSNDKRKAEFASPEIMPDYSILDPVMVKDLPAEVTRNTVTDALTHAVEAYGATWRNPYSDALAEKAVSLITKGIVRVVQNQNDLEGRNLVHIGASMAGSAFSNSQIGLAHAIGHAFGSVYSLPHGSSVGIFLPHVIAFNSRIAEPRYADLNTYFCDELKKSTLEESVITFLDLLNRPRKIKDLGIDASMFEADFDHLIELSMESTGIITNPRDVEEADIRNILDSIR